MFDLISGVPLDESSAQMMRIGIVLIADEGFWLDVYYLGEVGIC